MLRHVSIFTLKDGTDATQLVRALELLESEIRVTLALLGARSFDEVDEKCVAPAEPVVPPHATSPYTMLGFEELEYDR